MSHIVTIKTECWDASAVRAACRRLLAEPIQGKVKLFSGEVNLASKPAWLGLSGLSAICLRANGISTISMVAGVTKTLSVFSRPTP